MDDYKNKLVDFGKRFGEDFKLFAFTSLTFVTALWWHKVVEESVESVPFLTRHKYLTAITLTILTILMITLLDTENNGTKHYTTLAVSA